MAGFGDGAPTRGSPAGRSSSLSHSPRAAGLAGLLAALAAQGQRPRRVLFVSSTSVYAQDRGERVDESSPTEPRRFNGRLLLDAEGLLHDSPFQGTVVRFAGIYGPGRTRLLEGLRRGKPAPTEGPPRYTNRIHRDDCAGVLEHLMGLESPESLYLGVDCEPVEDDTLRVWLAEELGVALPMSRRGGSEGFRGRRCDNARLLSSGYAFQYPSFREGYAPLIRGEG